MKNKNSKQKVGEYLKKIREDKNLSLRDVEAETGISNSYLSQLESGKIKEPSPNLLHKLSEFYGVSYETVMELAGYPLSDINKEEPQIRRLAARLGRVTEEEEEELEQYLKFLRSRRRQGGRP
jgi:transcriptional regulator with XRE-family HTH domain